MRRLIMGDLVLVDESYKETDYVIARYMFGHVIISEKEISNFEEWLTESIDKDKLRFTIRGKMHFSDLTYAQKDILVEKISKIPLTFKVYVTYINRFAEIIDRKKMKSELLSYSIRHQELNAPNSKYIIEEASEYKNIRRRLPSFDLEIKPAQEYRALLIPDIMLGVFGSFLDRDNSRQMSDIDKWHTLIYNQIRLETFEIKPKTKLFLSRDKKIV